MSRKAVLAKIRKRDGRIVHFDQDRITTAIFKAGRASGEFDRIESERVSALVASLLKKFYHDGSVPTVEEVQDVVENALMMANHYDTAKSYILYREQHAQIRNLQKMIDSDQMMQDYLGQTDWRVRENANMNYSLQGLNNYVASTVSAHYWLNRAYAKEIRNAHIEGDLHIHDLQSLSAYCSGWEIRDLLLLGFKGAPGKIESAPAKHFRTALGQAVNFFYTIQGEVAGAIAFSNFDTYLAPFIRYDQLTYKEAKQSIQEFLFNMNVPTRVGFQTPFTNITLDLTVPSNIAKENVIIGGKFQPEKYGNFQKEMDMFNRAFAECMVAGDARGRVFTFPIPTYNIGKDFDWGNHQYDAIFEMAAKYGIPYFANFVNSDLKPEDARSMCPLAGDEKVLIKSSRGRQLEYSGIRNIYEGNSHNDEYEIYSDGKFVKGCFNKFANQKIIKVILENNHEIKMSAKHLNLAITKQGGKIQKLKGKELTAEMYLPYSLNSYQGSGGTKNLGYFVGAYAGDGSFDGETTVVFSLENQRKKGVIKKLIQIAKENFGAHYSTYSSKDSSLFSLKIHSRAAVGLCKDFVAGKEREKYYQPKIFGANQEFRQGLIEGHYATDGGNRHRIYTSSRKMMETLNMLAATLGTTTSIYEDNRSGRFGKEPNYAVLVYQLNRKKYGKFWFKSHHKLWIKIKSIEKNGTAAAYCFEVKNDEPVFTVGTTGILTHNCRLRLDNRELRKRGGGLFGANPLTGSVGVVTLNMPRIGYLAKNKQDFFKMLDEFMDLAKDSLEVKRKILEQLTENGLYPYCKFYLGRIKAGFDQYWKNHFSTIGLNGMNEAALNFMGETIATPKGKKFAEDVLEHMRKRLGKYQKETGNLYNLEATPAEGTSYRLAKADKKKYPNIVVANEVAYRRHKAAPYYTNSSQLPVNFTDDIFEALDLQDNLQTRYTGGTVLHGFMGEKIEDIEACKQLVKKIASNYQLPYFTITPTFSICPKHGYLAGEHFYCPKCDAEIGYVGKEKIGNKPHESYHRE